MTRSFRRSIVGSAIAAPCSIQLPGGIVFDESPRLKNQDANRSRAAQFITDQMRAANGTEAYVILMTGTPAPKSPLDWWSQCEIAWPGYVREGSPRALENVLGIMRTEEYATGTFRKRAAWKDDSDRCQTCGKLKGECKNDHPFTPGINQVQRFYERLKGLVVFKSVKECFWDSGHSVSHD